MKSTIYGVWAKALLRLCLLTLVSFLPFTTYAGDLKIGAASFKITPPVGIPLAGYYYARGAENIHDDLYAKAMVIESNGLKVAFVSCDLVGISAFIVEKVRSIVEKSTGIDAGNVMVSATHSHTGPVIPNKKGKNDVYKITGTPAEIQSKYISELPDMIAKSVIQANSALAPAKISIGKGHEESINFNRRYFMSDGTVGWNPGKLNPKIVKPAGPVDPDVFVLYAETSDGKPVSTYVNFALHLDIVSGREISADMPYTLSTILGKIKGNDMVTMFTQGCSGNINHINVKTKGEQKGQNEAKRIGTVLAGEVIKTYAGLNPLEITDIRTKREIVKLPMPDIKPDELQKAREIISRNGKPDAPPFLEMVHAYTVVDVLGKKDAPVNAEIQVMALGDLCAIVSIPGELFTELGMDIKNRSPFKYTIVVELANACIGYLPDLKAFKEGNYEPLNSRCAPGSGEILVEKALQLLNELKMK